MIFQLQTHKRLLALLVILFGMSAMPLHLVSQNNTRGAINGIFSVSANEHVVFSQGNLQYIGSAETPYWKFADHQWDCLGTTTGQNSGNPNEDRDLFGWGASGYDHGAVCYQPWSISISNSEYYVYGDSNYNLYDETGLADWGCNAIINGGNQENSGWRTLTRSEWNYLLNSRSTYSGIRCAYARVNDVCGLILLPDDWNSSYYYLYIPSGSSYDPYSYSNNSITDSQWVILEQHGAVFLPAAGCRYGTSVSDVDSYGYYWSASYDNNLMKFYYSTSNYGNYNYPGTTSISRCYGCSVRLIRTTQGYSFINTSANPTEDGAVSGGGTYIEGADCTLTAIPSAGCCFVNWTENGEVVSTDASYTFVVAGDRTLVANFQHNISEGYIKAGLFSVSEGEQVLFSQGNLQYIGNAETPYWKFADHQWDYLGTATGQDSESQIVDRDLFGWGTSGYNHGAVCYQPWSTSISNSYYYVYGSDTYNLFDQTGQADWGYNAIINGGNQANSGWRTLTLEEWEYLFNTRITARGIRFAKAQVNNINGVILLPDDWNFTYYSLNNVNTSDAGFNSNTITATQWNTLEQHGAVFLPAAGYRNGTPVTRVGSYGYYWSASYSNSNSDYACIMSIDDSDLGVNIAPRGYGQSVRLVHSSRGYCFVNGTPNPSGGGVTSGNGAYVAGALCTVTATPSEGYTFVNWTEGDQVVSSDAEYTFTVEGDRNLVANFMENPHWVPEDGEFEDNMTFTCVVMIDGEEQHSTMLELGAFCGNQCRGSQCATFFAPTQRYVYQMTIFGETGEEMSFRLYDLELHQELDLTATEHVVMSSNGYGTLSDPHVLIFLSTANHVQPFTNGWNWWSTYVELSDIDGLNQLENSLGFSGMLIKSRNNGYVEVYNNNGTPYWHGTLESICNEQMYKVRTSAECEATVTGLPAMTENHPITINSGWNWIGFPCVQNVLVSTALGSFAPEHNDVIKGRNGFATYYNENGYEMWYGTLNTLEPGKGYMYRSFSTTPKTLTYQMGRGETMVENVTDEDNVFRADGCDFADNMTITAVVEMEGEELRSDTYELAAFVGETCRGSVKLMYVEPIDRYVAFLTVLGESPEVLQFQLTDGTETSVSLDGMAFISDGMVGSLTDPVTLRFGTLSMEDQESSQVSVFPNPSEGVFRIAAEGLQRVEVFNALGQLVLTKEVSGSDLELDLNAHANGLYLLRLVTANQVYRQQIVKK